MRKKLFLSMALIALLVTSAYALDRTALLTLTNAQIATGDGTVRNLGNVYTKHTWYTVVTGGSSVSITLQGSLDGTNWFTLDTSTSTTSEMRHVVNKPIMYLKTNLGTFSGTSISAYVVSINE
jgi:hypothetical protein